MIGLGLGAATSAILDSGGNFQDTKAMSFDGATDQVATSTPGGITHRKWSQYFTLGQRRCVSQYD